MISFGRREQYIILVLIGVIVFGLGVKFTIAKSTSSKPKIVQQESIKVVKNKNKIYVHISGAVEKPGLYEFTEDDRVKNAVDKAIATDKADIEGLNLAEKLTDGEKIVVYEKGQVPNGAISTSKTIPSGNTSSSSGTSVKKITSAKSQLSPGEKVNINRADAAQLDKLPGIGPSTAQKIIDYRNANSGYKTIDEIKNVQGIGDKKYNEIKDYIAI